MSDQVLLRWFPYAFPFLFAGMWLLVTTMLGFMSGWFNLQERFPDERRETPLLRLRAQSGRMGLGVSFNYCLVLSSYPSGLGLAVWRIFGPFQRALLIPWSEIHATERRYLFVRLTRLDLGRPANGKLTIRKKVWDRLSNATKGTTV